jgi:hypothetical protein
VARRRTPVTDPRPAGTARGGTTGDGHIAPPRTRTAAGRAGPRRSRVTGRRAGTRPAGTSPRDGPSTCRAPTCSNVITVPASPDPVGSTIALMFDRTLVRCCTTDHRRESTTHRRVVRTRVWRCRWWALRFLRRHEEAKRDDGV